MKIFILYFDLENQMNRQDSTFTNGYKVLLSKVQLHGLKQTRWGVIARADMSTLMYNSIPVWEWVYRDIPHSVFFLRNTLLVLSHPNRNLWHLYDQWGVLWIYRKKWQWIRYEAMYRPLKVCFVSSMDGFLLLKVTL